MNATEISVVIQTAGYALAVGDAVVDLTIGSETAGSSTQRELKSSVTVIPNAVMNEDGAVQTVSHDAGFAGFINLTGILTHVTGLDTGDGESLTATITSTFDDGSTAEITFSISAAADDAITDLGMERGSVTPAVGALSTLSKSRGLITALSVKVQSSMNSSGAELEITFIGVEVSA